MDTSISKTIGSMMNVENLMEKADPLTQMSFKNYSKNEPMSILVIGCQGFLDRLKPVMTELITKKYGGKMTLNIAENIEQVLESGFNSISIDYVAIVCDTTVRNCSQQILDIVDKLKTLAISRLCLVNGSPKTGLEGSAEELVSTADILKLLYINGQIREARGCQLVSERLLNLAATCCGFHTGVPYIYPTPVEIYSQICNQPVLETAE